MATQKDSLDWSEEFLAGKGRRFNQKLKPYLVLQILMRETDENHVLTAPEIAGKLRIMGIEAERRSIYRDIAEINKALYMMENDCTIDEAEEALEDPDFGDSEKLVVYDSRRKGFYVRQRHYEPIEIRLMAECVYSAKFLSQKQANKLVDVLCELISEYQAKTIRHDFYLADRTRTNNKNVINNISVIDAAMSKTLDGKKHTPEKISFTYIRTAIVDITQQVERFNGKRFIASPYKLLINDGYYYLLAFDDKIKKMLTFRVDRMKDVRFTGQPRDGADAFAAIDLRDYTKRTFFMFSGKTERVEMRFINPLLDTAIDRFGTSGVRYLSIDEKHFTATLDIAISDQFFGWLLGFGRRVKLLGPPPVVEQFRAYMDKVREMY